MPLWLTPNNLAGTFARQIVIPLECIEYLIPLLDDLASPENWVTSGDMTADEISSQFADIREKIING